MPDQDDAYQVDDFNYNYQKISESFAGVPLMTNYLTLAEFIASGNAEGFKRGDTVAINNIIYLLVADNPLIEASWMPYGAEALVVMRNYYMPITERIKGSMYLQLGNTRRLIVKVFNKYLRQEPPSGGTEAQTLYVKEGSEKTSNTEVEDGRKYRFMCKNISILQSGDSPSRSLGRLYFIADSE